MKHLGKKILLYLSAVIGGIIVVGAAILTVDYVQKILGYNAAKAFVSQTAQLQKIRDQAPIKGSSICQPDDDIDHCPALYYSVPEDECVRILQSFGLKKDGCFGAKNVVHQGHEIDIYFGNSYEHPSKNITVTSDKSTLLWILH